MSDVTDSSSTTNQPKRLFSLRRKDRAQRPRRQPPFDLHKALFILPNAFTVASIFCGFYAILQAASGSTSEHFRTAALAIFLASFLDGLDGRIARLTKTQSDFGVQMDSLADVISFGVAPGVLLYKWGLNDYGPAGIFFAFLFTACGAIRLARFNVLAARGVGSSKFFVGLPIPFAAAMVVALVIAQTSSISEPVTAKSAILVVTLVLSYLMISRIRYRTFKDVKASWRTLLMLVGIIGVFVAGSVVFKFGLTLVCFIGLYILMGLVEEIVFFKKRRLEAEAQKLAQQTNQAVQATANTANPTTTQA